MRVKPLRSKEDHAAALQQIERLWGKKPGTEAGDLLDVLITLVEAYEREHFPMDLPDPIEAIKFRLEQQRKDYRALIGIIGQRTRVYEVMRGDRSLSLAMIRRLHRSLQIPAEVLIRAGKLRKKQGSAGHDKAKCKTA
jgi:HTH-type transcriptional regulator/antitoxin HigA